MITKRALKRYIDKAIARAVKRYTDEFSWDELIRKVNEKIAKPLLEMKHSSPDPAAKEGASEALYIVKSLGEILPHKARGRKKILTALRGIFEVAKKYATNAKTVPSESSKLYGIGKRALNLMADLQTHLMEPEEKVGRKLKEQVISATGVRQQLREKLARLIRSGEIKKAGERFTSPDGSITVRLQEVLEALKGGQLSDEIKALLAKYK